METTMAGPSAPLERSISQQSGASIRSHRSRTRKKLVSQPSSSASSVAPSDKSLTSFPSFSSESPRAGRVSFFRNYDDSATVTSSPKTSGQSLADSVRGESQGQGQGQGQGEGQERGTQGDHLDSSAIVQHLTTTSPSSAARGALFEDAPPASRIVPGALHHVDDEHIRRLIERHGAVNLVRQFAEDLAQRDAQISSMRRRAEERERALRKIILECGLSSLDLETRLRVMEQEAKASGSSRRTSTDGLSDLMTDAMAEHVVTPYASNSFDDATVRAISVPLLAGQDIESTKGSGRGWKDYLWGSGTVKKSSRASSTTRDASKQPPAVIRATPAERRPPLQEDLFDPPKDEHVRSSSRASSTSSAHAPKKPSLASMALRLVAGGASIGRDGEIRGRASSAQGGGSLRTPSSSSLNTTGSARAVSAQGGPKALMAMRRPTGPVRPIDVPPRSQPQERWDTMVSTPGGISVARQQSYGPVEMDTILPPDAQPPTLTHIYNNHIGADFLTDRFGFIYDQRRKKRQREAAQMVHNAKMGSRTEMVNGRGGLSPALLEDGASGNTSIGSDGRPGTPNSSEEPREDAKPKRWQDYLKIATFPTELLSHTPLISAQGFEVLEAADAPKSPSHSPSIVSEDRGFLPSATTTAAITPTDTETQPASEGEQQPSVTLAKEDTEPVRLLLENLNNLHDTLQREKTVRWNDFLRKVRAERKRDGEAAAAAAAAAAEARFQRATAVMPETRLGDGELIGVASLGVQGKTGRAKANEFKSLVLSGIPVAYRAKIWSECSGAKALRIPGYYDSLLSRPESTDDPQVVAQIKADITRTLTDNIFFRKGPGVRRLDEILLAYSRRNPDVGYCQGMNLVAANLLLITPTAEDAFWILCSMVESILPPHYFDHSLLASRADQVVLRSYVRDILPRLSAHLDALSIDLETMTFQWFLSLFTDCLSAEALFRVWDVVLCTPHDGGVFLFQNMLLTKCGSPAEVYSYINHEMTNHAISIDGLVQASEALRRLVRKEEAGDDGEGVTAGKKAGKAPAVVSQEVVLAAPSRSVSRASSPRPLLAGEGGGGAS
ncbi:TBC-domain-containing protein [Parathielavia hyrcaniae]|uniref:TBC-domain-containing protein n=1 Tax=Parathielavia hyrcaniae TaxID=113614 RepID=A0AAN6Q088_9PEZI|nr:TBC-domain-containing protein [Parathielavia hyrcaniae]